MLSGYRLEKVAEGQMRQEGNIVVGGGPSWGVVQKNSGRVVFAPADSVALAWAAGRLWSWRESLKEGESGVSYGDYTWKLERYSLSPQKDCGELEVELEWSHALETSPGGTPESLGFLSGTKQRILRLHYTETDFPGSVYVVLLDDGTVEETGSRQDALDILDPPAPAPKLTPPTTPPLLEDVLAHPEDDEARRRYAAAIGGARGEYIELSLLAKPGKEQRARRKELLTAHKKEWAAELGAGMTGLRWDRGFIVQVNSNSQEVRPDGLLNPLWRLVECVPGNYALPDADLLDQMEELGGFNLADFWQSRKQPWNRLRKLTARLAEIELLHSRPEHFPAIKHLKVYNQQDEAWDWEKVASVPGVETLELIGELSAEELATLLPLFEKSPISELIWAPHQGGFGGITFEKAEGRFAKARIHKKTQSWISDALGALPKLEVVRS